MSRAILLAIVVTVTRAEVCGKTGGDKDAPTGTVARGPSLPSAEPTVPPIWAPPETAAPPTPAPPTNPDLAKARAFAQAGEHKKVRGLLEKKLKTGKATSEEAAVLLESCTALRDKACSELVKAKFPDRAAP